MAKRKSGGYAAWMTQSKKSKRQSEKLVRNIVGAPFQIVFAILSWPLKLAAKAPQEI